MKKVMKKQKIEEKGITLIVLVITIIVLLILTGVSIAMLTGQNGVLTRAKDSNDETVKAEVQEKINLALNEIYTDILSGQSTISTPTIGATNNKSYSVGTIDKTAATVVDITWTDTTYGTYKGSITYDSTSGKYTIVPAAKQP